MYSMNPGLTGQLADDHVAELRRSAAGRDGGRGAAAEMASALGCGGRPGGSWWASGFDLCCPAARPQRWGQRDDREAMTAKR